MEKMTYAEALTLAIELIDQCEDSILDAETECPKYDTVKEKLTTLRAQVDKRNSAERKPTKVQIENERLKSFVFEALGNKPQTVTEFMATSAELCDLSKQKVAALVNALVDEGKVVKTIEKRKSYFSLPSDEDAVQALPSELSV